MIDIVEEYKVYSADVIGTYLTIVFFEMNKKLYFIRAPFCDEDVDEDIEEWDKKIHEWIVRNFDYYSYPVDENIEDKFLYKAYFNNDISEIKTTIREWRLSKLLDK